MVLSRLHLEAIHGFPGFGNVQLVVAIVAHFHTLLCGFGKRKRFPKGEHFSFRSPSFPAVGFCMRGSLRKEWKGKAVQAHFENKCVSDLLPAPSVCFTDFAGNRTAAGKLFPCLEPGAVHQKLPSISGVHPMKHEENQKRVEKSDSEQEKCWIILGKYVIIHYYVSESTHEGNRSDALPIKKESRWL